MSGVRVLVGTRKGAFILTADGKRDKWEVSGPHFGGWEMYHLKGSPVNPNRRPQPPSVRPQCPARRVNRPATGYSGCHLFSPPSGDGKAEAPRRPRGASVVFV